MLTNSQIESQLSSIRRWYWIHYPLCIFCGHRIRKGGGLAHLIRRSHSIELQPVKLNTGLAHHDCHEIFDDHPDQAVYLPRIIEVLYIIWMLDRNYFNQISHNFEKLADIIERFPGIPEQELDHHGELLQLTYLLDPSV